MKLVWVKILLPGFLLTALGVCGSPQKLMAETTVENATIILPDGTECYFAGQGATLTFEGKRLSYTCGDTLGLIGDITIANGTDISLETATINGTTITGSTPQTLKIQSVVLANGDTCLSTSQGPSRAIQDKPLSYICQNTDPVTGLTGTISEAEGVFRVESITQEGFDRGYSQTVSITSLTLTTP